MLMIIKLFFSILGSDIVLCVYAYSVLCFQANHTLYPSVFIYGESGTGKSLVVHRVLNIVKVCN